MRGESSGRGEGIADKFVDGLEGDERLVAVVRIGDGLFVVGVVFLFLQIG